LAHKEESNKKRQQRHKNGLFIKQKTVEVQALSKWGKALDFIFSDFACLTKNRS
jgi:hypothetical protein